MKIEDAPLNTTLVFPVSKGTRIWAFVVTVFSLAMVIAFIFMGESVDWDLRQAQWEGESGEKSGPMGNLLLSWSFGGMSMIFTIVGFSMFFDRGHRLIIDKARTGNVYIIHARRLRKDKVTSISRLDISAIEVVAGDSETPDELHIISGAPSGIKNKLTVDSGNKKYLIQKAHALSAHLDVEIIER